MSDAKRCDRCGNYYQHDDLIDAGSNGIMTFNKYGQRLDSYDLCKACIEEFKNWISSNGRKNK